MEGMKWAEQRGWFLHLEEDPDGDAVGEPKELVDGEESDYEGEDELEEDAMREDSLDIPDVIEDEELQGVPWRRREAEKERWSDWEQMSDGVPGVRIFGDQVSGLASELRKERGCPVWETDGKPGTKGDSRKPPNTTEPPNVSESHKRQHNSS